MTSWIMHVDIDAFFASVEQARDPRLRGRPVIVGSGVIASCSYEARRWGLYAGMPITAAQRQCPDAVIVDGRYATYRCFSDRVFELCRRITPDVETYLDEAYCDLTGVVGLYGGPNAAATLLKRTIRHETGLTVSVGLGATRTIAKIAAGLDKPDGLVMVDPDRRDDFLRALPVDKLPGIGPARGETLARINIHTVGALRDLGPDTLDVLFGGAGRVIYQRAAGCDTELLDTEKRPRSISRETAFHADTDDPHEIEGMLHYLTERAGRALRELGLKAGAVCVHVRYADGRSHRSTKSPPTPTDLDAALFGRARTILTTLHTRRVRLHAIGVKLANFSRLAGRQQNLFGPTDADKLADLYRGIDRLRRRYGHAAIMTGKSLDAAPGADGDLARPLRKDRNGYVLRTPCLTK